MAKVIVDHNGICEGYHFKKGEPVELPENVVKALGQGVTVLEETKVEKEEETKVEKEAEAPANKMVSNKQVVTK